MLTQVRSLRDLDLGALPQQHPDRNLQPPPGWIHDTDRTIPPLRSANDLQGSTMKRVKGVEDLKILIIGTQGILSVGVTIRMSTVRFPPADSLPITPAGSIPDIRSSYR